MAAPTTFEALFRPIQIGPKKIKNRVVMPAMGTLYATWNGRVTSRMVEYYRERARGGVGLIVVEYAYVHRSGQVYLGQLGVDRDTLIGGLAELARVIKEEGAVVALQLFHGGRLSFPAATGSIPLAPSPITSVEGILPKALNPAEIAFLEQAFVDGAMRARMAGFDAIELHMGHGYLIHSFLTPLANNREDRYGGNLTNRARFALEVLEKVRKAVGNDYPVMCKLSASDYMEGGLSLEEVQTFAKWLEAAGISAITVSGGYKNETDQMVTPPMALPRGFRAELAHQVKRTVSIPVISVGRINEPSVANRIIEEGKADMVAIGRALLADPQWPIKVEKGLTNEICHCIACNQGCIGRIISGLPITCLSNPAVGREEQFRLQPAPQRKKVVVIGGGPGGLTAARIAALREHRVVLVEKGSKLGGRLAVATIPPYKEEINSLVSYLVSEISRLGVEVLLGTKATADLIEQIGGDEIILASGAVPVIPTGVLPGQDNILLADDVLHDPSPVGERVAIIGGGMVGLETAEFLIDRHREVIVIEMGEVIAPDLNERVRKLLLDRLWSRPIDILLKTLFKTYLSKERTMVVEREGIVEHLTSIENVVVAMGYRSETCQLLDDLTHLSIPITVIGDAVRARSALEAIREGFEIGYSV